MLIVGFDRSGEKLQSQFHKRFKSKMKWRWEKKKVKKTSPSFSAWVTGKKALLRGRTGQVIRLPGLGAVLGELPSSS